MIYNILAFIWWVTFFFLEQISLSGNSRSLQHTRKHIFFFLVQIKQTQEFATHNTKNKTFLPYFCFLSLLKTKLNKQSKLTFSLCLSSHSTINNRDAAKRWTNTKKTHWVKCSCVFRSNEREQLFLLPLLPLHALTRIHRTSLEAW